MSGSGIRVGLDIDFDERMAEALVKGALADLEAVMLEEIAGALHEANRRQTDELPRYMAEMQEADAAWRKKNPGEEPDTHDTFAQYLGRIVGEQREEDRRTAELEGRRPDNDFIAAVPRPTEGELRTMMDANRQKHLERIERQKAERHANRKKL